MCTQGACVTFGQRITKGLGLWLRLSSQHDISQALVRLHKPGSLGRFRSLGMCKQRDRCVYLAQLPTGDLVVCLKELSECTSCWNSRLSIVKWLTRCNPCWSGLREVGGVSMNESAWSHATPDLSLPQARMDDDRLKPPGQYLPSIAALGRTQ